MIKENIQIPEGISLHAKRAEDAYIMKNQVNDFFLELLEAISERFSLSKRTICRMLLVSNYKLLSTSTETSLPKLLEFISVLGYEIKLDIKKKT